MCNIDEDDLEKIIAPRVCSQCGKNFAVRGEEAQMPKDGEPIYCDDCIVEALGSVSPDNASEDENDEE